MSLIVKAGALVFVFAFGKQLSINLQLLGAVWIPQTFPAIVADLYTRWFHRWALLVGWAAAMIYGTVRVYRVPTPGVPGSHWGGSSAPILGHVLYIAIAAFLLNPVVSAATTVILRVLRVPDGTDETLPTSTPRPWRPPRRPRCPPSRLPRPAGRAHRPAGGRNRLVTSRP